MTIPFDLWGQRGWAGVDVAGESHYARQLRSLFVDGLKPGGTEIEVTVQLVPESANTHDRHAIAVRHGDLQLGYLPRDEATRYTGVLSGLVARGWAPQVTARVWASEWSDDYGGQTSFTASVRLQLAEPHMLVPANLPPGGGHRMLPAGAAIQVTGEEQHLDDLAPYLRPEGECWVHVTLHEIVEQSARTTRELVEVRIDGVRVGQLTPKMSGELLPAVRHLAAQGNAAGARAVVKGNRIKTEVVLYVARAHELPHSWLGAATDEPAGAAVEPVVAQSPPTPVAQREHGPIPPRPTGVRFVVPDGWPTPPRDWIPPQDWRPDPSWPAAPDDWQWWVPVWD